MSPTYSESPPLNFELALRGQRVFVTGHTGFTGGWLVSWLKQIGCEVAGLALLPTTEPSLFATANIADGIVSTIGDIRDFATVRAAIERHKPSVVIHLAAQPLVSKSFADPIETFATNALGTAHGPVDAGIPRRAPRHEYHEALRSPASANDSGSHGQSARGKGRAYFWAYHAKLRSGGHARIHAKHLKGFALSGAPEVIRTPDLLVRRSRVLGPLLPSALILKELRPISGPNRPLVPPESRGLATFVATLFYERHSRSSVLARPEFNPAKELLYAPHRTPARLYCAC